MKLKNSYHQRFRIRCFSALLCKNNFLVWEIQIFSKNIKINRDSSENKTADRDNLLSWLGHLCHVTRRVGDELLFQMARLFCQKSITGIWGTEIDCVMLTFVSSRRLRDMVNPPRQTGVISVDWHVSKIFIRWLHPPHIIPFSGCWRHSWWRWSGGYRRGPRALTRRPRGCTEGLWARWWGILRRPTRRR